MTFTPTPPTEPGPHYWQLDADDRPSLVEVVRHTIHGLCTQYGDKLDPRGVAAEGGLWCRLVPVEGATTQGDSLVAAIEGDYSGMAHADLVATCKMLASGRETWRKEAEALKLNLAVEVGKAWNEARRQGIGAGTHCEHNVRWPHECKECADLEFARWNESRAKRVSLGEET